MQIELRGANSEVRAVVVVSAEDYEMLTRHRWSLSTNGYAKRNASRGERIYMHRAVLGLGRGDGLEADHINGDTLDNRRENLRALPRKHNQQNRHGGYGASRSRGVYFDKATGRWRAQGKLNGRAKALGRFDTEEEADAAVKAWREENMKYATT